MPTLVEVMEDNRALASLVEAKDREISRLEQKLLTESERVSQAERDRDVFWNLCMVVWSSGDKDACWISGSAWSDLYLKIRGELDKFSSRTRQASHGAGNANPNLGGFGVATPAIVDDAQSPGNSTTVQVCPVCHQPEYRDEHGIAQSCTRSEVIGELQRNGYNSRNTCLRCGGWDATAQASNEDYATGTCSGCSKPIKLGSTFVMGRVPGEVFHPFCQKDGAK